MEFSRDIGMLIKGLLWIGLAALFISVFGCMIYYKFFARISAIEKQHDEYAGPNENKSTLADGLNDFHS